MLTHANTRHNASARPQAPQIAPFRRNPGIHQLLGTTRVQPKLRVGAVNDPAEAEADRVADHVMRMPEPASGITGLPSAGGEVRRMCAGCEEEAQRKPVDILRRMEDDEELQLKSADEPVQRKCPACEEARRSTEVPKMIRRTAGAEGAAAASLSPSTEGAIRGLGAGSALPASERAFFEPRFGRDLSGVRVHAGGKADEASRSINARAFTLGNNIAFASGEYRPGTSEGRKLMAHELTHTLQQGGHIRREVYRGVDNNGSYRFDDQDCTFQYHQDWYFTFHDGVAEADRPGLMATAATQVHDTWSNKFQLIPMQLLQMISCACSPGGVSVEVVINPVQGPRERRGIAVNVEPSVRAVVNPITGGMRLEENATRSDIQGTTYQTGLQYTVAHEFGHTIDLNDEYNGLARLFTPSVQSDTLSMLNTGNEIRPRHYQYFADMLSWEILGCRFSPNGIRQPDRERPVFRGGTLSGLTTYQDGLNLGSIDNDYNLGQAYDFRLSNERIMGLFYPQLSAVRIWNSETASQSDVGLTIGARLSRIAYPFVVNIRAGIVTNPLDPTRSVRLPFNLQAGIRTAEFELGIHYTPVLNILEPGQVDHLFGVGGRF